MNFTSVNKLFEASFKTNWDRPAISNYQGETFHYRDIARKIEKLHIMFEECGLEKGNKVALCSFYITAKLFPYEFSRRIEFNDPVKVLGHLSDSDNYRLSCDITQNETFLDLHKIKPPRTVRHDPQKTPNLIFSF